ncbi:MAG TPA: hypothetical protein PLI62_14960 [Spirochaetota bacterium]|nr:hypothetical protein [Spirochaetota bacterium]HQP50466.1 hypothetical protein [Spirochaetota bacterium]
MKILNIILFMFWFFAFVLLFGDMYTKFNLSYNTILIITVAFSVILVVGMIVESVIRKKE